MAASSGDGGRGEGGGVGRTYTYISHINCIPRDKHYFDIPRRKISSKITEKCYSLSIVFTCCSEKLRANSNRFTYHSRHLHSLGSILPHERRRNCSLSHTANHAGKMRLLPVHQPTRHELRSRHSRRIFAHIRHRTQSLRRERHTKIAERSMAYVSRPMRTTLVGISACSSTAAPSEWGCAYRRPITAAHTRLPLARVSPLRGDRGAEQA